MGLVYDFVCIQRAQQKTLKLIDSYKALTDTLSKYTDAQETKNTIKKLVKAIQELTEPKVNLSSQEVVTARLAALHRLIGDADMASNSIKTLMKGEVNSPLTKIMQSLDSFINCAADAYNDPVLQVLDQNHLTDMGS